MKQVKNYAWLLLLFAFSTLTAQPPSLKDLIPLNAKVKTGQLPNGLRYFILQNKKPENKVELRLAVNAGSIQENDDQQGLAHFMEHMNFNGLKHFPHNDIVHYLQSVGVKFGADLNAYTSFEETVYMLPIPTTDKSVVEKGFTILADWSQDALLDNDEIDKERGVVLEESRLGKGADDRMMKKYLPELLNGSIYAKRLPIGKDEILQHFKYEVVKKFHHDWYRPNNEAVVVVGDIDPDEAERLIKEKFSGFKNPKPEVPRGGIVDMPNRTQNKAMVVTDKEANFTFIQINGNNVKATVEKTVADYRQSMVKNIFDQMLGERFNALKDGANPPFIFGTGSFGGGWVRGWESYGVVAVCGTKQVKDAVKAIVTESMKAKKFGFTNDELERAKAAMLSQYESMAAEKDKTESSELVAELVRHFLTQECAPGIEWEYNTVKSQLPGITLKEVNEVAKKIDIDEHFFALITAKDDPALPTDAELLQLVNNSIQSPIEAHTEKQIASSLLKTVPVAGKIVKEESNSKIGTSTYTLNNGAVVTIKPTDFKNDEVLLSSFRFGGSSLYEGTDFQSGKLANRVVDEMGYGDFSKTDLEKYLSGKKATVQTNFDDYTENLSGSSSVKDIETMFQLIYLKCTAPRKDETALRSYISRQKQQFEMLMQSPEFAFTENTIVDMNQHHPRAHILPSSEELDAIDIDHSLSYYQQRMGNVNGMHFYITGNIKPEEIKPLIEKYIGSLPGGPINTNFKDLKIIPKPGINRFTFNKGKEKKALINHYIFNTIPYNIDEAFYLNILNEVINNKITDTIREAMSAIYGGGINGSPVRIPREQYMLVSRLPCGPENVDKVDKAFWSIIESVKADGGITEADISKARKPLIEKNKTRVKTNQYWNSLLLDADKNGYSAERVLTYEDRINAITPEKLKAIALKFYNSPNIYTAVLLPEE